MKNFAEQFYPVSEWIPDRKIQNPVFAVKIPFGAGRPVRFTNRNSQIETNHQDAEINAQTGADPNRNLLIKLRCDLRSRPGRIR